MIGILKKLFNIKKDKKMTQNIEKYPEESLLTQEKKFEEQIYSFDKKYENINDIDFIKYQIQIINSKLDAISAKIDSLTMKINYLENTINSIFYRR